MENRTKRLCASLLAAVFLLSLLPPAARAADEEDKPKTHNISERSITISKESGDCPGHIITQNNPETATQYTITVQDGTHDITLAGVNIDVGSGGAFSIQQNAKVNLTLAKDTQNNLKCSGAAPALWIYTDAALTIQCGAHSGDTVCPGEESCGSLTAENDGGTFGGQGIGSGSYLTNATIYITGGRVTATGAQWCEGIGGIQSSINISGGTVTATSGEASAVIGGQRSSINISGGTVTATGGEGGVGIGGQQSSINISGGTVTATGGAGGAGIGDKAGREGSSFTAEGDAVIFASSISDNGEEKKKQWKGIIVEGNQGKLYGETVTPTANFTIPQDTTVTIPKGSTLDVTKVKMTNNGTVENYGTVVGANDAGITQHATGINLDSTLSLESGKTAMLTAKILPENAVEKAVTWESGDEQVATVDENGKVTAISPGTATITASVEVTDQIIYTAECAVTVNAPATYSVTVEGGTTDKATAAAGDTVTITATVPSGQKFNGWTVESGSLTLTDAQKQKNPLTFTMPAGAVKVTAGFQPTGGGGGGGSSGGGGGGSTTYKPDVQDSTGGGAAVTPKNPEKGDTVTVTPKPDAGYEVEEITVTDKNDKPVEVTKQPDGTFTFTQPGGRVTIRVTYRPVKPAWVNPFDDVDADAWYAEAVQYVVENGLMVGTAPDTFSPHETTNRGMIAAVLYRMAGSPDIESEIWGYPYADVDVTSYYGTAVYWARMNGIASGYSDEAFGPGDPITREQLAVMLYRYAGQPPAPNLALTFDDAGQVSDFADHAMRWAVDEGILSGTSSDTLSPQGEATRAQVAAMLMRFCEQQ